MSKHVSKLPYNVMENNLSRDRKSPANFWEGYGHCEH